MANIHTLPWEILERIYLSTDGTSIVYCRSVCTKWKEYIDHNETLWKNICLKEYRYSSQIAKQKCGNDMKWSNIYKNLKKWGRLSKYPNSLWKFYNFSNLDRCHALNINQSILPLRELRGTILYDMSTLKYIPVVIPDKNLVKMVHNENVSIILVPSGLYVQRSVNDKKYETERFFKANDFVLSNNYLYYTHERVVFLIDLQKEILKSIFLTKCDYDIKQMVASNFTVHLFTDCGKILSVDNNKKVKTKFINCPEEWVKSIKHICPIDDRNYICYSRNLFQIETDNYRHLYLDFPTVTATFFYGDTILIGTKAGEILLYRMSDQKKATKPIFEKLCVLPEQKFAVNLDVYEKKHSVLIMATTFFEVFILEFNLEPQIETEPAKKGCFTNKIDIYKRLLRLNHRLKNGNEVEHL